MTHLVSDDPNLSKANGQPRQMVVVAHFSDSSLRCDLRLGESGLWRDR
jgi:hypothetical protein